MNVKTLVGMTLGALLMLATAAGAEPLNLRISGENDMDGNDLIMADQFAKNLKAALGDEFEYEFFHTGALGNEEVHLQMIRTGQIDAYPMGSDAATLDSNWAIFDVPFLFPDRATVTKFLDGEMGEELRASMRKAAGLEILAFGELGFRQITNNIRPIVKPEDLKGIKLRVPGSPARILAFSTFGAQPLSMNFDELYLALDQGTVDGQENPLDTILSASFFEVQKYLSISRHVYSPVTFVMNGAKYDSLTDAQRAAVKEAAQKAAEYTRNLGTEADATLVERLSKSMKVNEIDAAAFKTAAGPIWEELAKNAEGDFVPRAIKTVSGQP